LAKGRKRRAGKVYRPEDGKELATLRGPECMGWGIRPEGRVELCGRCGRVGGLNGGKKATAGPKRG